MKSSLKVFVETAIHNSFSIDQLSSSALDTTFPNRLSYHRILLIEKGSGTLVVDDKSFKVKEQQLFLLAKGQVYIFEEPSIVNGYVLCFGDCFWEKAPTSASNCKAVLFNDVAANQCLQLSNAEFDEFMFLFKTLQHEFKKVPYINQIDAMAAYLKIIMIKVANVRVTDESTFESQDYLLYRKFMELLSTNYKTHHEVRDYAEMLGITARRLSDVCKRCSKRSTKDIINSQLVAEAKRTLQFSPVPVKEIAYTLNFTTPEQFSHFFKKNTTFSPADFRNKFVQMGK
jgi:AraC family transcriptional activator of pobA